MQLLLLALSINVINGWSTFHEGDKAYIGHYKGSATVIADCEDELEIEDCAELEKHCHLDEKIRRLCKKTCGFCRAVSPASCEASKYGCCWDNVTTSGFQGESCPKCEDELMSCKKMVDYCHMNHVRRGCPLTCQVPGPGCFGAKSGGCFDHADQAAFCPTFKKSGFCERDINLMKIYCEKTCDLCGASLRSLEKNANPAREVEGNALISKDIFKKKMLLPSKDKKMENDKKTLDVSEESAFLHNKFKDLISAKKDKSKNKAILEKESKDTMVRRDKLKDKEVDQHKPNKVAQDNLTATKLVEKKSKDTTGERENLFDAAIEEALGKRAIELNFIQKLQKKKEYERNEENKTLEFINMLMNDEDSDTKKKQKEYVAYGERLSREMRIEDLEAKLLSMLVNKRSREKAAYI